MREEPERVLVEEIMTNPIISTGPDTSIEAVNYMHG